MLSIRKIISLTFSQQRVKLSLARDHSCGRLARVWRIRKREGAVVLQRRVEKYFRIIYNFEWIRIIFSSSTFSYVHDTLSSSWDFWFSDETLTHRILNTCFRKLESYDEIFKCSKLHGVWETNHRLFSTFQNMKTSTLRERENVKFCSILNHQKCGWKLFSQFFFHLSISLSIHCWAHPHRPQARQIMARETIPSHLAWKKTSSTSYASFI